LLLNPVDAADLHLKLATAIERTGDLTTARKHALSALEETPRFREAHKRLLEIVRKIEARIDEVQPPAEEKGKPSRVDGDGVLKKTTSDN
jgi:hypothetical protein